MKMSSAKTLPRKLILLLRHHSLQFPYFSYGLLPPRRISFANKICDLNFKTAIIAKV